MMVLMSISEAPEQVFFDQTPESAYWDDPQALPSFLVEEPVDRLLEDEVPIQELEDAYAIEAMIYGGAK